MSPDGWVLGSTALPCMQPEVLLLWVAKTGFWSQEPIALTHRTACCSQGSCSWFKKWVGGLFHQHLVCSHGVQGCPAMRNTEVPMFRKGTKNSLCQSDMEFPEQEETFLSCCNEEYTHKSGILKNSCSFPGSAGPLSSGMLMFDNFQYEPLQPLHKKF